MDSAEDRSRQLQDQAGRVRREKLEDIPYSRLVEIAKNLLLAKRMQSQVPEDIVFNTMLPMNYIRVNNLVHNEPGGAHHKCNKNKEIKTKVKGKASAYPDEVAHAHDQSPDPEPTDNMILETEDMGVLLIPGFLDRTDVENLRWDYQFKRLIDFKV